jgi:flagellar biosynthesis protein FlhB
VSDPSRTHKASPKREQDFRKRGDIALSRDLVSAAALTGGVIGLIASSGRASTALLALTRDAALATDGREPTGLVGDALDCFIAAGAPVLVGAAVGAVIATLAQLGWPPAIKGVKLDLSKMSPIANLGNVFGIKSMVRRTGAAVAKMIVVGAAATLAIKNGLSSHAMSVGDIGAMAWAVISRTLWLVLGAIALIAAVDYLLARRRMAEQMKMTPDELKREHKESEGDPMLKGRRRQKMRELARRRMAAAVAKADVIVVNPTHYAVALRYDESTDRAPLVVAKGVDESAEKIREVARQHGVPVLSRPPLARALHKHVKEGRPVPANLFRAVAEVLAYVYRLKKGSGR